MDFDALTPWPKGKPPEPQYCTEKTRASILAAYGLDALEDDPELSEITSFAAKLCGAPIALVSLVEEERQRFIARAGLKDRETPRPVSFCAHAMLQPEPMVVCDAQQDERFETNPLVTGHPHIRFYAGAPLVSHEGAPLGSLCVIDTAPREEGLTEIQAEGLQVLAGSVMRRLRHRRENLKNSAELQDSRDDLGKLIDSLPHIAYSIDADGEFGYVNARYAQVTGNTAPSTAEDWRPVIHPEDHEPLFTDWAEAFANSDVFEGQFRLLQRDGSWRWAFTRNISVQQKQGLIWFGTVTDIHDAHHAAETRDLLNRELSHRIKNIFAVIGGLVALKSREYDGSAAFAADVSDTLQSLNRAHSYVTQEQQNSSDTLHGLLEKLMAPYADRGGSRFSIAGEDAPIGAKSATPLALVFHELATNSAKYGSFSVPEGSVAVTTQRRDDKIVLKWRETGGPPPEDERGDGFGSRLVERSVSSQLSGTLTRAFEKEGLSAMLTIPLAAL